MHCRSLQELIIGLRSRTSASLSLNTPLARTIESKRRVAQELRRVAQELISMMFSICSHWSHFFIFSIISKHLNKVHRFNMTSNTTSKPVPCKPRRPLSSYNLFYRYKRVKINESSLKKLGKRDSTLEDIRKLVKTTPGLESIEIIQEDRTLRDSSYEHPTLD